MEGNANSGREDQTALTSRVASLAHVQEAEKGSVFLITVNIVSLMGRSLFCNALKLH